jgi:hypothetical protein
MEFLQYNMIVNPQQHTRYNSYDEFLDKIDNTANSRQTRINDSPQ